MTAITSVLTKEQMGGYVGNSLAKIFWADTGEYIMQITYCPPAYASGYVTGVSDLSELDEDTQRIRMEAFVPIKLAATRGGAADKYEMVMAKRWT